MIVETTSSERPAEHALERAERLLEVARATLGDRAIEIYLRAATRIRALAGDTRGHESGHERGIAVRVARDGDRGLGFAAASGWSEDDLEWVIDRAVEGSGRSPSSPLAPPWPSGASIDQDPDIALPSGREIEEWVSRRARGVVREWVEVGTTVEALASTTGLRAARARRRAWSVSSAPVAWLPDVADRPAVSVGSGLQDLDSVAPIWPHDLGPGAPRIGTGPEPLDLVLEPSAAAPLVMGLARTFNRSGATLGIPVGPGLRLVDDPTHSAALSGGTFDDVGYPTRAVVLADGSRTVGRLEGLGHLRRASYRDIPEPLPSALLVEPDEAGSGPLDAYVVVGLRLVPLTESRWSLELDGYMRMEGRPTAVFVGARIVAESHRIAAAVISAPGPARRTAEGVITPPLVLRGLSLET